MRCPDPDVHRPRSEQSQLTADYFRLLLENGLDIVTVLDPDGTVRYTSPAIHRVLGYDVHERPGKNIYDFVHPDDSAIVKQALASTVQKPGTVQMVEFRYRHKDGSWREFESLSKNLLDNPAVAAIVINARDITARKQAEGVLRESEAALRESHSQLAALTARLFRVEEGEHRRLARELHDDVNQQLAMISVEVDVLASNLPLDREEICRRLRDFQIQLGRLSDDLHRMAHQLHPSILEDLGLVAGLRSYCSDLSRRAGISISFQQRAVPRELPNDLVLCIYRVAQESLRNVVKHSKAKQANVSLTRSKTGIRLSVKDPGAGFQMAQLKGGLGLLSMEERVRLAGGKFSINSQPGGGTSVEAELPFPRTNT
jgi:PAS domain S-box-containing protein